MSGGGGDPFVRPGLPREPHLQALVRRYPQTGDASTTKHEWITEQHRDTIATVVGRRDQLVWLSVADNISVAELRNKLLTDLVDGPCEVGNGGAAGASKK
jgi:splicing factor 3B subunit 5